MRSAPRVRLMLVLGIMIAMLLLAPLTLAQEEAPQATPAPGSTAVTAVAEAAPAGEQAAGVSTLVLLLGISLVFLIGIGAVLRDTARSSKRAS